MEHKVHWGYQPPLKTPPPLSCHALPPPPPVNQQTVQAPSFLGNPPSVLVFHETLLKVRFFSELPKY